MCRNAVLARRHIPQIGFPPDRAPNAWLVMFPQAIFAQLSPSSSEKIFFCISITLLTPRGSPPIVSFHPGLCGADYPATSRPGPANVLPASEARSTATHAWPPSPSLSHSDVFLTSMLIWWAYYNIVIILFIFLPSLIAHPNGRKLFLFPIRPRRHVQRL